MYPLHHPLPSCSGSAADLFLFVLRSVSAAQVVNDLSYHVPRPKSPEVFRSAATIGTGCLQPRRVVGEQREVVHVAQMRRPQHVGHEVVEAVEVDVREELARQVADRQPAAALVRREQAWNTWTLLL